jgi:cell division protein FtsL
MNEQNILDAIYTLSGETEKLRIEVSDLKKINAELKTKVHELSERINSLD